MEYKKELNWNKMSEWGLVYLINDTVLHPLGLAMTRNEHGQSLSVLLNDEPYEFTEDARSKHIPNLKNIKDNIKKMLEDEDGGRSRDDGKRNITIDSTK